jgi:hypothetical protein
MMLFSFLLGGALQFVAMPLTVSATGFLARNFNHQFDVEILETGTGTDQALIHRRVESQFFECETDPFVLCHVKSHKENEMNGSCKSVQLYTFKNIRRFLYRTVVFPECNDPMSSIYAKRKQRHAYKKKVAARAAAIDEPKRTINKPKGLAGELKRLAPGPRSVPGLREEVIEPDYTTSTHLTRKLPVIHEYDEEDEDEEDDEEWKPPPSPPPPPSSSASESVSSSSSSSSAEQQQEPALDLSPFKQRVTDEDLVETVSVYLRKATKEEKKLNVSNLVTKYNLFKAWQLLRSDASASVSFYPPNKDSITRAMKQNRWKVETTKAWHNLLSLPSTQIDGMPRDRFLQDVYFIDCETHLFSYAHYLRQIACINLKGDRSFKTSIRYLTRLHKDYETVSAIYSTTAKQPQLVYDVEETLHAPTFAQAMIELLTFLKAHTPQSPLLLFQGRGDPSWIKFCYDSTHEQVMPMGLRDTLQSLLEEVHPRFASMESFWQNMKTSLHVSFSSALPSLTKKMFFPKVTKAAGGEDADEHEAALKHHLFPSVKSLVQKLVFHEALPDAVLTATTSEAWKDLPGLRVRQTRFAMDYVQDVDDLVHHEADADCMILRNTSAAVLVFQAYVAQITPGLKVWFQKIEHAKDEDDEEFYRGTFQEQVHALRHLRDWQVPNNQMAYTSDIFSYLFSNSTEEYDDEVFEERFQSFFRLFLSVFRIVLPRFASQHIAYTQDMATMLLMHVLSLPLVLNQRPSLAFELLQVDASANVEAVNKEKRESNVVVLTDQVELDHFLSQYKEDVNLHITEAKSKVAFQTLLQNRDTGRYDFTRMASLYEHYYNEKPPQSPVDEEELQRRVFDRRNWPVFYSITAENRAKHTPFRLHHRLCHIYLTKIHATITTVDGKQLATQIRCYKNPVSLKSDLVYTSQSRGNFVFCKDCKRFQKLGDVPDLPVLSNLDQEDEDAVGDTLRDYMDKNDLDTDFLTWQARHYRTFEAVRVALRLTLPETEEDKKEQEEEVSESISSSSSSAGKREVIHVKEEEQEEEEEDDDGFVHLDESNVLNIDDPKDTKFFTDRNRHAVVPPPISTPKPVKVASHGSFLKLLGRDETEGQLIPEAKVLETLNKTYSWLVYRTVISRHDLPLLPATAHDDVVQKLQQLAFLFCKPQFVWTSLFVDSVLDLALWYTIVQEASDSRSYMSPEFFIRFLLQVQFLGPHTSRKMTFAQRQRANALLAIRSLIAVRPKWRSMGCHTFKASFQSKTLQSFIDKWELRLANAS